MQSYELILKNERLKTNLRLHFFFAIASFLLFFFLIFFSENGLSIIRRWKMLAAVVMLLSIIAFFEKKKRLMMLSIMFYPFMFVGWMELNLPWLALFTILLGVFFLLSTNRKSVVLDEEKIIYPSFPKKRISWEQLNNVLVKDGLLTIDFKSNKIIQQLIDEYITPEIDC